MRDTLILRGSYSIVEVSCISSFLSITGSPPPNLTFNALPLTRTSLAEAGGKNPYVSTRPLPADLRCLDFHSFPSKLHLFPNYFKQTFPVYPAAGNSKTLIVMETIM